MMGELRNGNLQSTNANGSGGGINQSTFAKRLQALYLHWRLHKHELWGSADFVAIATPSHVNDVHYLKSSTLHIWLLGYDFSETVTVFGKKQIHFLCSQKKASLLETMKTSAKDAIDVDIVIHVKLKGEDGTSKLDAMLNSMRMSYSEGYSACTPIVGYIFKESLKGSFLQNWADKLKRCGLQLSDVTDGLSDFFAIKDPNEEILARKAAFEAFKTARARKIFDVPKPSTMKSFSGPKPKRLFEEEKIIYRGPSTADTEKEEFRRQHQAELTQQKNEETARRLANGGSYGANLNTLNELIGCNKAKLVQAENKFKPIRLSYLYIHPFFGGPATEMTGALVAHANGFRYSTSTEDEQVDIMYANIKHAFFQPAEIGEMIPLLHFHLHSHIMVGNKKTKDVQFYLEDICRVQTPGDETRSYVGLFKTQEGINMVFQDFVNSVHDLWLRHPEFKALGLKFEQPSKELGFFGVVPYKASACIVPTSSCLVELEWSPFLIITLSEIEIVNLERIRVGQKDFDMAIVFKDFQRDVMHIASISFALLDRIKEWLDNNEMVYFESRVNLNWRAIMKTFIDDPQAFINVGGWEFLNREKEVFYDDGGFVSLDLEATETWSCYWNFLNLGDCDEGKTACEELKREASNNTDSKEEERRRIKEMVSGTRKSKERHAKKWREKQDATTLGGRKEMNPTAARKEREINKMKIKAASSGTSAPKRSRFM